MTAGMGPSEFSARSWSRAVPDGPGEGVVRFASSRAWYLTLGERLVAVLHGPDVDCVPGGVQLDAGILAARSARSVGVRVRFERDRLHFAGGTAPAWTLQRGALPAWECGSMDHEPSGHAEAAVATAAAHALTWAGGGDVSARTRFCSLLDALADPDGDLGALLDRLVGFGPGLTPSGDDLLVGLLAALQARPDACGPTNAAERLRRAVAVRLATTTAVGRFYLEHGLDGRFGAALLGARRALVHVASNEQLDPALQALVAVGATSGADLLFGLAETLSRAAVKNPEQTGGPRCAELCLGVLR